MTNLFRKEMALDFLKDFDIVKLNISEKHTAERSLDLSQKQKHTQEMIFLPPTPPKHELPEEQQTIYHYMIKKSINI